jgi:hypothetical protein
MNTLAGAQSAEFIDKKLASPHRATPYPPASRNTESSASEQLSNRAQRPGNPADFSRIRGKFLMDSGVARDASNQAFLASPASVLTRCVSREIFRALRFLCTTPLVAARAVSDSASRNAILAASASPAASASSTLRQKVRIRDRRALLIAVRRAMTRMAFFAEAVFAMTGS